MAKKQEFTYEDGDFVVYPTHGVGRILGVETTEVVGTEVQCSLFVLSKIE